MKREGAALDELLSIPVDASLTQSQLNIEDKTRSNLFPWNGQFSPELISALLAAYSKTGDTVLDPFMGSGTVLVESARHNLECYGSDINPAPFTLANVYRLINASAGNRRHAIQSVESSLSEAFPTSSLFTSKRTILSDDDIKSTLVTIAVSQCDALGRVLVEALIVLLDYFKPNLTEDRVFSLWNKLKSRVHDLPYSRRPVTVMNCDARRLPLKDKTVSLTITSPPYINVFNYHQMYRASVEALGWDLLHVARSEIGSNRKHRGNRFLTVTQYCLDIADSLSEIARLSKRNARCIMIVGRESNVLKTHFLNAALVLRVAKECLGFRCVGRQERVFINRFGKSITEDILHLVPPRKQYTALSTPQAVSKDALVLALQYAPAESIPALSEAIESVSRIENSPLYLPKPMLDKVEA